MPLFFQYLIKLSCSLAVVYVFYQLLLRRLTFYTANRWYLLGYSALCFIIPFINITGFVTQHRLTASKVVQAIPVLEVYTAANEKIHGGAAKTIWDYGWLLFVIGMMLLLARLVLQIHAYWRMRRSAKLLARDGVTLYQTAQEVAPFSFGSSIFINPQLHSEDELKEIIQHEFVHVRQRHTLDIIWMELLCIFNWYNPAAWALRRAVRQNLEFIADSQVLHSGVDKKRYQYLLLKVVSGNHFAVATPFNFSSLKKRIVMMNKIKSAKAHLLKFLFVLPLAAVLLLAFRDVEKNRQHEDLKKTPLQTIALQDTLPVPVAPPVVEVPPAPEPPADDYKDFLKRNSSVKALAWTKTSVFVHFKKGGYNEFHLNDSNEMSAFEKQYGNLPQTPPRISGSIAQEENIKRFMKRNPDVSVIFWQKDSVSQQPQSIGITFKNDNKTKSKKEEVYYLDSKNDMQRFEAKFGAVPVMPPMMVPPPPPPPMVAPPVPPVPVDSADGDNTYMNKLDFLRDKIGALNDSIKSNRNLKGIKDVQFYLKERNLALQKEQHALQNYLHAKQAYLQKNGLATQEHLKALQLQLQQRREAMQEDQKAAYEYLKKMKEQLQKKQKALQETKEDRSS